MNVFIAPYLVMHGQPSSKLVTIKQLNIKNNGTWKITVCNCKSWFIKTKNL